MPPTIIPGFIAGAVLAIPAGLLTIILWGAMRAAWPRFAAVKTLIMWAVLVTIFAFVVSGIHWPAYGTLSFVGGNVAMTACLFVYFWRRRPQRFRGVRRC